MHLRLVMATTLALGLLVALAEAAAAGQGPPCAPGAAELGSEFAPLRAALGEVMGVPTTCPQPLGNGDLVQATSTGLAIYRARAGRVLFSSAEQHWALTGGDLVSWTGNWHNGLDPPAPQPVAQDAVDLRLPRPSEALPTILVVTLVGVGQDDPRTLALEADGALYQVRAGEGCPDAPQAVGRPVFVRSPRPLGSPDADLVLLEQGESCPILALQSTAAPAWASSTTPPAPPTR